MEASLRMGTCTNLVRAEYQTCGMCAAGDGYRRADLSTPLVRHLLTGDGPMRTTWLLVGFLVPALAAAETRRTTVEVKVRKRAGEKAEALAVVPAGTDLEVVREDGRWVVVRFKGTEGYVTRSTLSEPPPSSAPPAPAWSGGRRTETGLELALYVEITAPTAVLRAERATTSNVLATLARGARIAVLDATSEPAWIHGRDDQGHDGWIARGDVTDGSAPAAETTDPRGAVTAPVFHSAPPRALELGAAAGVGFRSLGMDLTSNSAGGLTNYLVDADSVAATLGVDALLRTGAWFVGFDGAAQTSVSSPGIDYPGPTSAAGKVAFRTVTGDVGVRAGRRVRDAIELALRLGGHYDAFLPRDVDNAGMLPRERLLAATIGARVELRPRTSRFGAVIRTDVLAVGSRAQTPGLEDGTSSSASAIWGGVTVRLAVTRRWMVFGAYDFARMSTAWSGMSSRQPGVTSTHRIDTAQLVQLGVGAEL